MGSPFHTVAAAVVGAAAGAYAYARYRRRFDAADTRATPAGLRRCHKVRKTIQTSHGPLPLDLWVAPPLDRAGPTLVVYVLDPEPAVEPQSLGRGLFHLAWPRPEGPQEVSK